MTVREVITIDEELCDGCGLCVPSCAEGAIVIVDGKARLVDDRHCDGLGACLGECPQGAISVVRRETEAFVGPAPQAARADLPVMVRAGAVVAPAFHSCPGSRVQTFGPRAGEGPPTATVARSELAQWPVQLHLLPPTAPFLAGADLLVAADCTAFAMGDLHQRLLRGRALAIACPKLDSQQEVYVAKLAAMIDGAELESITVAVMEVPCCGGLVRLVQEAARRASRRVPITALVVGVRGEVLGEQRVA